MDLNVHSNAVLGVFAVYLFLLHGQINVVISLQIPETVTPRRAMFSPYVKTELRKPKTRETLHKRGKNHSTGVYRSDVMVIYSIFSNPRNKHYSLITCNKSDFFCVYRCVRILRVSPLEKIRPDGNFISEKEGPQV